MSSNCLSLKTTEKASSLYKTSIFALKGTYSLKFKSLIHFSATRMTDTGLEDLATGLKTLDSLQNLTLDFSK